MPEDSAAAPPVPRVSLIVIGAICGLAWAAGFRSYMVELAGFASAVDWVGTFVAILLPGALIGALLGWAESLRRAGGARGWRWLALAPLIFPVVPLLMPGALVELVTTGLGGGAVAVALIGLGGGFALSGRGPLWGRLLAGVPIAAALTAITLLGESIGGSRLALTDPRGAWVAVLVATFLMVLALASSIPHRRVVAPAP